MNRSLDRVMRPSSIAVFGGKEARRVIEQCDRMGFSGAIWPVHPAHEEICGRKAFRSAADLPEVPDAAFVGVNRSASIGIVASLSAMGAGGVVCYASGFREVEDGHVLQDALVEAAGDMPLIGPNCYGLINALDGALMWPDQHGLGPCRKGVAILTQSSNIAINLSMQRRGLPIAYLMTAGNQAQTGLSEMASAVLDDPRVTAIGLHIEGFDDIRRLEELALKARRLQKPVVALKTGRSEGARRATVSHTASLAGDHAVSAAILGRLGIGQVDSLPALIETLKLLHANGPLKSRAISSMSCSGGEAALMADALDGRRIAFRPLADEQLPHLRQALGDMVTLSNPLDYHTFVWGDLDRLTVAFAAMMRGGYGLNLLVLDMPRADRCDGADWLTTIEAIVRAANATGEAAGIVATLPENLPEDLCTSLLAEGIVPFLGIVEALTAAEAAAEIGEAWARPPPEPFLSGEIAGIGLSTLDEYEAKKELSGYGLSVPVGRMAMTPEEAADCAREIGFPVALKALGIAHKTEAGGVRLNLSSRDEVIAAARAMSGVAPAFLVERMAEGPTVAEVIVGASRDPVAGLVLTVGAGGVYTEIMNDAAQIILPTTPETIEAALASLRIAPLLHGYRGLPAGDLAALVQAIAATANYVADNAPFLEEIDINPLIVLPRGRGVVAADAMIRRRIGQ